MKLSARQVKAWEKFNEDLNAFRAETGEDFAILYEDAYTTRQVKDFKMTNTGKLTWWESETYKDKITQESEQMIDDDDSREWLNFWRANLRRAKRYWSMDTEKLDAIQDGQIKDEED
jgi:hypothetical protein